MGPPSSTTLTSFQVLIDELKWEQYAGQTLPASLQSLLSNTPTPDPYQKQGAAQNPNPPATARVQGEGGNQRGNRDGVPIANNQGIERIWLLDGKFTHILHNVALPTPTVQLSANDGIWG